MNKDKYFIECYTKIDPTHPKNTNIVNTIEDLLKVISDANNMPGISKIVINIEKVYK